MSSCTTLFTRRSTLLMSARALVRPLAHARVRGRAAPPVP